MGVILELSVVAVMFLHLMICPFTKVEESFNIQAIHDILYHKFDINQYDHLEFPGVVPRSFIGPIVVTFLSAPMVTISQLLNMDKMDSQYIVRFWLGILVAISFISFSREIESRFGKGVKFWLIICSLTQFHFMFYMSRPLPNVFALALALFALSAWLRQNYVSFVWISGASIIIFRSEMLLFLAPVLLSDIFTKKLPGKQIPLLMVHAVLSAVSMLGLTVLVDSMFWGRWLWPEGEVWWYNIILNKSSNWGIEPYFWYFYSALVRALSFSILLIPLGVYIDRRVRSVILPAIIFIFLFSFLPHKELRFIIYTFPVLNIAVACGLNYLWINRSKSVKRFVFCLIGIGLLVGNVVSTSGFLYISIYNYPGGQAIKTLHSLNNKTDYVYVHIDVYSAQTGITRFTQLHNIWRYDKTEDLPITGPEVNKFSHLLMAASDLDFYKNKLYQSTHNLQATIYGFSGISLNLYSFPPVKLKIESKIWLLKRK